MSQTERLKVKTAGIGSEVLTGETCMGHVVMADFDATPAWTVIEAAQELDGPAVIAQSSGGEPASWHVYGLQVREWPDVEDALEQLGPSEEYVAEMRDRARCVLRTQPKILEGGEMMTPSPVPVDVVLDEDSTAPISRPHIVRLRQLAEEAGRCGMLVALEDLEHDPRATGETLSQDMWAYRPEVDR